MDGAGSFPESADEALTIRAAVVATLTSLVGADLAVSSPLAFTARTSTRNLDRRSRDPTRYFVPVAPLMAVQARPAALQRSQR